METEKMGKETLGIKMYSIKEVAQILNVTHRTLSAYLIDGRIKGQKIGNKWHISEQNLKNFLNGEKS